MELEVGFGKGLFLVRAAPANPLVNFIGVEILRKYQLFTATRLAKRGLGNVRLARADARLFLRDCVATSSLHAVHVYFPDPWWKKRHYKRRVFTPEFAAQCQRVLQPGGRLHLATDVEETYGRMLGALSRLGGLRRLALPKPSASPEADYRTNFERKAREQGKSVYQLLLERVPEITADEAMRAREVSCHPGGVDADRRDM